MQQPSCCLLADTPYFCEPTCSFALSLPFCTQKEDCNKPGNKGDVPGTDHLFLRPLERMLLKHLQWPPCHAQVSDRYQFAAPCDSLSFHLCEDLSCSDAVEGLSYSSIYMKVRAGRNSCVQDWETNGRELRGSRYVVLRLKAPISEELSTSVPGNLLLLHRDWWAVN